MATKIIGGQGGQYNLVHDANEDFYIAFLHQGAQIIANEIIVRNNETNVEVFRERVESMATRHLIPAETLTNGVLYNVQFIVYWHDSEDYVGNSELSDTALLQCYSTPTVTLNTIISFVRNASYTFDFTYKQDEDDYIDHYKLTLYGVDGQVLQNYADVYPATTDLPYVFSATATNLADKTSYYLEMVVTSVSGLTATTGRVPFTVEYKEPDAYLMMYVENEYKSCSVRITSNVKVIDGHTLSGNEPTYIDGEKADLRDDTAYWETMMDVVGDFQSLIEVEWLTPYKTIFQATNGTNTIELRTNYSLVEGYERARFYLELFVSNPYDQYMVVSNSLTPPDDYDNYHIIDKDSDMPVLLDQYLISIVRRGYVYKVTIQKKE